jgi:crotonobetainyl-CoA:carnitine CoA-transferase CaiB-like acyl-CoA transferase
MIESPTTMNSKPLFEGIKVLAAARRIAAPFATCQRAMHGAVVLTVDNPKEIDSMRLVAGAGGMIKFGSDSA